MSNYNVGNIFGFSCGECEYNRNCYGGNLGNQFKFCQKSKEKLESFDKLQQENKKYKEVIDKLNKLTNMRLLTMYFEDGGEISVLSYKEILDILKEVE